MAQPPLSYFEYAETEPLATGRNFDVCVGEEPAGTPRSFWVKWKPQCWQRSVDNVHRCDGKVVDENLSEWISRHMSWLLRHGARDEGLPQDQYRCVPLVPLMRFKTEADRGAETVCRS